jgi:prepilin peptidase CpaA
MAEWINYILLVFLVLCAASDVRTGRIPNVLTLPFSSCALSIHFFNNGVDGLIFSAAGMATGIGLLILPYLVNGIGAGDVKFMGAVGGFLGAEASLAAFILIALAGGVYSLAVILIHRDVFSGFFREKLIVLSNMVMTRQYEPLPMESSGKRPRLKYGVAIAFGTITYLLLKSLGIKFFA